MKKSVLIPVLACLSLLVVGLVFWLVFRGDNEQIAPAGSSDSVSTNQDEDKIYGAPSSDQSNNANQLDLAPLKEYVISGGEFKFAVIDGFTSTTESIDIAQVTFDLFNDQDYESRDSSFFLNLIGTDPEIQFEFELFQAIIGAQQGQEISFEATLDFMKKHRSYGLEIEYQSDRNLESEIIRCNNRENGDTMGRFNESIVTLIDSQGQQYSPLPRNTYMFNNLESIVQQYKDSLPIEYFFDPDGEQTCSRGVDLLTAGETEQTMVWFAVPLDAEITEATFCENCSDENRGRVDLRNYDRR